MTIDDVDIMREPSTYHLKIKDWPSGERPREKLVQRGVDALSDAELLAILIHSGSRKITALDIAKSLLKQFGNFREISKRSVKEMTTLKGIGVARAVNIFAALEIGKRMSMISDVVGNSIHSPADVASIYIPKLRDQPFETFYVLLLNAAGKIIKEEIISRGTVNASLVHRREVFGVAGTELATGIILMHNHPGGTVNPSKEDRDITNQLVEAGKLMDIPVHDHVIICGDSYVSFVEKGWI